MQKLIQELERQRAQLDTLRRRGLKETPTRTIVVSGVGHLGSGDLELGIGQLADVELAAPLIRMSFDNSSS